MVSNASSILIGGRIVGNRLANIDLPAPGGPMRIAPSMSINATYFTFFTAGVAQNSTAISTTPYAAGHTTLDVTVTASSGASGVGSIGAYTLSAEL